VFVIRRFSARARAPKPARVLRKIKFSPEPGIEPEDPRSCTLSTKPSLYPTSGEFMYVWLYDSEWGDGVGGLVGSTFGFGPDDPCLIPRLCFLGSGSQNYKRTQWVIVMEWTIAKANHWLSDTIHVKQDDLILSTPCAQSYLMGVGQHYDL